MSKKVVVISTSIRANSNSDILAKSFADGATYAGMKWSSLHKRINRLVFARVVLYASRPVNV